MGEGKKRERSREDEDETLEAMHEVEPSPVESPVDLERSEYFGSTRKHNASTLGLGGHNVVWWRT
jgi:hypothetical protein